MVVGEVEGLFGWGLEGWGVLLGAETKGQSVWLAWLRGKAD